MSETGKNKVRQMLPTENDNYGMSGMAEAMKWVSVVTTVVGMMIVPALGGFWIDNLLGSKGVFTILGVVFGFVGGMYGLLHMVKADTEVNKSRQAAIALHQPEEK
jgi:F0F1-type ATP synthase assembly protein I